jgi:hypothetical protein
MFAYADKKQATTDKKKVDAPKTPSCMRTNVPNETGIPDLMKTQFENLSGFSFDDVRVHYNSGKPAQLQALAYTQGNNVYIAPGQGKHLEHELGHVVQQKAWKVPPEVYVSGVGVNESPALEVQASLYAREAMSVTHSVGKSTAPSVAASSVAQKASNYEGILPRHELLGGEYMYKGARKTDFTYHHIIPENFLNSISGLIESLEKGQISSTQEYKDFKKKALDLRKDTRTKDTFMALNKRFPGVITFDEADINTILAEKPNFAEARTALRQTVSTNLHTVASGALLKFCAIKADFDNPHTMGDIERKYVTNVIERSEMLDMLITREWFTNQFKYRDDAATLCVPVTDAASIFTSMNEKLSIPITPDLPELDFLFHDRTYGIIPIIDMYLTPPAAPGLKEMMAWIPGNIHRGPISDIRSKSDDGGDGFETSASNVMQTEHYIKLKTLHEAMKDIQTDKQTADSYAPILVGGSQHKNGAAYKESKLKYKGVMKKITKDIKKVFELMNDLFDCGFTDFDPKKWQEIRESYTETKMTTIFRPK